MEKAKVVIDICEKQSKLLNKILHLFSSLDNFHYKIPDLYLHFKILI